MKKKLQELSIHMDSPIYLCSRASDEMFAMQAGHIYESSTPKWLQNFIADSESTLHFEQEGEQKHYFKWELPSGEIIIFLDSYRLSTLLSILNYLLAKMPEDAPLPSIANGDKPLEIEAKFAELQEKYRKLKENYDRELEEFDQMTDIMVSLREQNIDQAARLKEALAQNLELSHKVKNREAETNSAGSLQDEISRLQDEVNHYKQASTTQDDIMMNMLPMRSGSILPEVETGENIEDIPKNLAKIVTTLNHIAQTGDAAALDLDIMSTVIVMPTSEELATRPELAKNIAIKLIGMERSGRLSSFQLQRLNDAVKS